MKVTALGSAPVTGFIPTKNFNRAKAFYGKTLGLRFIAKDDFALVFESGRTMIRVVRVRVFEPAPFTILGWQVADIGRSAAALRKRGVRFQRFPGVEQDKLGIWTAPGGAKVAWFKDPDGNVLSISFHGKRARRV